MASNDDAIRLLVVARHPFRLEDLGLDGRAEIGRVHLIRRPREIETAIDESEPNVVLIDVGFPGGRGFDAIGEALGLAPAAGVLRSRPTLHPMMPSPSRSGPEPAASSTSMPSRATSWGRSRREAGRIVVPRRRDARDPRLGR